MRARWIRLKIKLVLWLGGYPEDLEYQLWEIENTPKTRDLHRVVDISPILLDASDSTFETILSKLPKSKLVGSETVVHWLEDDLMPRTTDRPAVFEWNFPAVPKAAW